MQIRTIGSQVEQLKIRFYCFKFMSMLSMEFKVLGDSLTFRKYSVASVVHKRNFTDRYYL